MAETKLAVLQEILRLHQLRQNLVNILSFNVTMEPAFWNLKNVMMFVIAALLAKMKKIVRKKPQLHK